MVECFSKDSFVKFIRYIRTNKVVIAVIDIVGAIHKNTKSNTGLIKIIGDKKKGEKKNWNSIVTIKMGSANPKSVTICTVLFPILDLTFIE